MKNPVTCDVCMDLLPLVKDGVASEDSRNLVLSHIENCDSCHALYHNMAPAPIQELDDKKNLMNIRNKLYLFGLFILVFGAFLGVYLSNSMGVFYNFIIMPFLGAFGFFILKNRYIIIPVGVFILSYLWLFIGYLVEHQKFSLELLSYPIFFSFIYTLLTFFGVLIGILLNFAFRKEK